MFAKVKSAYLNGISGVGVAVECDVSTWGMPNFFIVGLADSAIKESKERVKSSLKFLDYHYCDHPVTINLAPADLKKEGTHFDLPIAISILKAADIIESNLDDVLLLGELSLDGNLRGVSGILSMVEYARDNGINKIILPEDNMVEASLIPDLEIYGFKNLGDVIGFLRGDIQKEPFVNNEKLDDKLSIEYDIDFKDVKGQFVARRAAEVAACGMHNFVMIGSPGSGKTMIARRLSSILPPMTLKEALETTKIHSVAGLIKDSGSLINKRPFVSPHHTSSNIAIIGGGSKAKPGNVSVASNGILFLDEMLEFSRSVLEVLRQPLEDRFVTIARAGKTVTYPAKFMLVAAMNPCPCGYLGDSRKPCTCTQHAIDRYRAKLSGPMLDRIDLISHVEAVDYKDLMDLQDGEPSSAIRQRVIKAHEIQRERFKDEGILYNSEMNEKMIRKYCNLDNNAQNILAKIMEKHNITARSYSKILKTSRTIADMDNSQDIKQNHILEAFQMKLPDNVLK